VKGFEGGGETSVSCWRLTYGSAIERFGIRRRRKLKNPRGMDVDPRLFENVKVSDNEQSTIMYWKATS